MSGTFEEALHAAGLRPRDVIPDGLWHRCPTIDKPKKKNGVYKLDVCGSKGWYRNWGDVALGVMFWKQDGPARTRYGSSSNVFCGKRWLCVVDSKQHAKAMELANQWLEDNRINTSYIHCAN